MNELPTPTFALSPVSLPRGVLPQPDQVVAPACRRGILVSWARHQDEVRQAQRLKYRIFCGEMGARLDARIPGHDVDLFDALDGSLAVEPPALIKGYLRLGAKVLGPPAWDLDFNSADLPMLMRIADLSRRYRKHFLRA